MSQVMRRSIAHRYATRILQLNSSQSIEIPDESPIVILSQSQSQTHETPAVEVVAAPNLYKQLQDLEEQDGVIRNNEFIFCVVCNTFIDLYDGIYVRNCLHQVCIDCIRKTIIEYAGVEVKCPNDGCEYYLQDREIRSLLTQPEYEIHSKKYVEGTSNEDLYKELLELEEQALIRTNEVFECQICYTEIQPFEGIMIRECLHQFCIDCVRGTITSCEEAEIKCPAIGCDCYIHDREVRSLLTQSEFDKYNAKLLRIAESKATNSYHCKLANCEGWCIVEEVVNEFICPRCSSQNCLSCQVCILIFCPMFYSFFFMSFCFNFTGNSSWKKLQAISRRAQNRWYE